MPDWKKNAKWYQADKNYQEDKKDYWKPDSWKKESSTSDWSLIGSCLVLNAMLSGPLLEAQEEEQGQGGLRFRQSAYYRRNRCRRC
jgi:hypothetical protein